MIYSLNCALERKKSKKIENNMKQANYRKGKFVIVFHRKRVAAPASKAVLRRFYSSILHNFNTGNQEQITHG